MSNERATIRQLVSICVSAVLLVVLTVLLVVNITRLKEERSDEVPTVVSSFLEQYLAPEFDAMSSEDSKLFYEIFEELGGTYGEADPGYTHVESCFLRVFKFLDFGTDSYEVEVLTPGFAVVRLYSVDGDYLPPPIGVWFEISPDGEKIVEWCVGRLLPFSRYDSEYSEDWDDIY